MLALTLTLTLTLTPYPSLTLTLTLTRSGSPYPAQIRFNVLKKCEPLHYRVWGHIPTPKPQGFNQFELHLDADQASKLAALLMSRR